jgi:hypothetical protein
MKLSKFLILVLILNSCARAPQKESTHKAEYNNSKLVSGILNYRVPGSWQRVQPSSSMRVDEFLIDPISQTTLAVFIFPKVPNLVEMNISRWASQFTKETLTESRKQFNQDKLPITIYHAEGSFLDSTDMMNPDAVKITKNNFAMLAAIVELNDGAWFFKTVGPKEVLANQISNFEYLISSISLQN